MSFRLALAESPIARLAALPVRTRNALRHLSLETKETTRWLIRSREHHNYTYNLTPRNLAHLAWWVSEVTGADVSQCRDWIKEALEDEQLVETFHSRTLQSNRRGLADLELRIGRRAGWYAIIRANKPRHVLETGTDKGLGSLVCAAALLRNGSGRLTTVDINPSAGYLICSPYSDVTSMINGDSVAVLSKMAEKVDLFIHDSDHTDEHERAEIHAVSPRLSPEAVVLSDNAHATDVLQLWSESQGRRFLYFQEEPDRHWYPGAGIGASWMAPCN